MLNYSLRIHSLMIPTGAGTLLLPNANVAEVVPYNEPESIKGAPDWLTGFVQWREIRIPLVSFETLLGKPASSSKGVKWMVVMNALGGRTDMPFFALVVQGKPKLIQVDESVVTPIGDKNEPGVLRHVHVHGDPAIIPDPDYIEHRIRELKEKIAK